MDIDRVEDNTAGVSVQTRVLVPVDDNHPFDLESYISNYSGEHLTTTGTPCAPVECQSRSYRRR